MQTCPAPRWEELRKSQGELPGKTTQRLYVGAEEIWESGDILRAWTEESVEGCDGSRVWCCIREIGQRFAESCSCNFGYKHTSQPPKESMERQGLLLPQLVRLPIKWGNGLILSCSTDTAIRFSIIVSHILCLSGAPRPFSVVWKDHENRQGMAEEQTTNELGFTAKGEEVHLPLFLCCILLFYTCSSMGLFPTGCSSSQAAAAF